MHIHIIISTFLLTLAWVNCKVEPKTKPQEIPAVVQPVAVAVVEETIDYDSTAWIELTSDDGYVIDVKYASTDNFIKAAVYPCGRMFLRREAAKALSHVRDELKQEGYKLKLFDGYRPRPVQQKLWDKVPNRNYVAPPWEGSMHNRGVAIDLTLTDRFGKEIDMGTRYDFFGPEAHHDYTKHSEKILGHRKHLKLLMENHGFRSIRTEWWHYSLASGSFPLEDWQWSCP